MERFRAGRAISEAAGTVTGHPGAFLRVTLGWSVVLTLVPVGYCLIAWQGGSAPLDLAGAMDRLSDDLRLSNALTSLPAALGSLAVSVWWTRFTLRGAVPGAWISVPAGSGRYLGRELILVFGLILANVPGLLAGKYALAALGQPYGGAAAAAAIGINLLVATYLCLRLWLVFPAIALGDDTSFARAFALGRGLAWRLLGATVVVEMTAFAVALALVAARVWGPAHGLLADVLSVATELGTNLAIYAGAAMSAAVSAIAYRSAGGDAAAP